jgi:hypothetical protein
MKKDKMKSQDFDSEPDFTIIIDVFPNGIKSSVTSIDKEYKHDTMRILGGLEYFKVIVLRNQHEVNTTNMIEKRLDTIYERVDKLEEKL